MQSWKNNLTQKLNNEGIFVGKGKDKFYNIKTSEVDHNGSQIEVTMGINARTNQSTLIDWRLTGGEPIKNINDWLLSYARSLKPSDHPTQPSPSQQVPGERLGDPHE